MLLAGEGLAEGRSSKSRCFFLWPSSFRHDSDAKPDDDDACADDADDADDAIGADDTDDAY